MKYKETQSNTIDVFVTGDKSIIYTILQKYCKQYGFCFSIQPIDYIYTNGMESGFKITIINYARFPKCSTELKDISIYISEEIIEKTYTGSASVVTPTESIFISNREDE